MKRTSWSSGLSVTADGAGVISHAGAIAPRLLADRVGLTAGLSEAMARRQFIPVHDRGRVLIDVAVMLAGGVESISDIGVLRHQSEALGPVASAPTVWRAFGEVSAGKRKKIQVARARTRRHVWSHLPGGVPGIEVCWAGSGIDDRARCGRHHHATAAVLTARKSPRLGYKLRVDYITSPIAAEQNAAAKMREFGFVDAETTGGSADAGIDVHSGRAIAQVKWQGAVTSRPDLQRLYGSRGAVDNRELLFFSASGYSSHAIEYADSSGIALFTYNPLGEMSAVNSIAENYISIARDRRNASARTVQIGQPKSPIAPSGPTSSGAPLVLGGTPMSAESRRRLEVRRAKEQAATRRQEEEVEGCLRVGCGVTLVSGFGIGLFAAGRRLLDANDVGAVGWSLAAILVCIALISLGIKMVRSKR